MGRPTKVIAACLALTAFALAALAGLRAGNPADTVLQTALLSTLVIYPLGLILGAIGEHVVETHLANYRRAHPIPRPEHLHALAEPVIEVSEAVPTE